MDEIDEKKEPKGKGKKETEGNDNFDHQLRIWSAETKEK